MGTDEIEGNRWIAEASDRSRSPGMRSFGSADVARNGRFEGQSNGRTGKSPIGLYSGQLSTRAGGHRLDRQRRRYRVAEHAVRARIASKGDRSAVSAVRGYRGGSRWLATRSGRQRHISAQQHAQCQQRYGKTSEKTAHACMEHASRKEVPHCARHCNLFHSCQRNMHKR